MTTGTMVMLDSNPKTSTVGDISTPLYYPVSKSFTQASPFLLQENAELRREVNLLREKMQEFEKYIKIPKETDDIPFSKAKDLILRHIRKNKVGIHISDVALDLGIDIEVVIRAIDELKREDVIGVKSSGN